MTNTADTDQLNAVAGLLATARDQLEQGEAAALARTLSDLSRLANSLAGRVRHQLNQGATG